MSFFSIDSSTLFRWLESRSSSEPKSYKFNLASISFCFSFGGLFFSVTALLKGFTIAIAFPLKVFFKTFETLPLEEAEDLVDLLSESESESVFGLHLVGSRMGRGDLTCSDSAALCSAVSWSGCVGAGCEGDRLRGVKEEDERRLGLLLVSL